MQKYFLKLQKAGLPIPGRQPPNRNAYRYFAAHSGGRKKAAAASRLPPCLATAAARKSTFLTSIVPPVEMEDSDTEEDYESTANCAIGSESRTEVSGGEPQSLSCVHVLRDDEEKDWPPEVRDSEEFRLLQLLKMVKAEKGR